MPYKRYPATYAPATRVTRFVPRATLVMGGIGAVVGGVSAAARNIRLVGEGKVGREEAVKETFKEAVGVGLATAAATAVVGAVGATGFMGLAGIVVMAIGAKYIWDTGTVPSKPGVSPEKAAPEKEARKEKAGSKHQEKTA